MKHLTCLAIITVRDLVLVLMKQFFSWTFHSRDDFDFQCRGNSVLSVYTRHCRQRGSCGTRNNRVCVTAPRRALKPARGSAVRPVCTPAVSRNVLELFFCIVLSPCLGWESAPGAALPSSQHLLRFHPREFDQQNLSMLSRKR